MRSSRKLQQKFLKSNEGGVVAPEVWDGGMPPKITPVSERAVPPTEPSGDIDATQIPFGSRTGAIGDGLEISLTADARSNWLLHQFCERRRIWQMSNAVQVFCVSALAAVADGNVPF